MQHLLRDLKMVVTLLVSLAVGGAVQADVVAETARVKEVIREVRPAIVKLHCVNVSSRNGKKVKHQSVGSGVIVDPRGYVVTNYHVAGDAEYISCTMWDKREIDAVLVGTDALTDIAVVRLQAAEEDSFVCARFGDDRRVEAGDRVVAMGSPMAFSQSATVGVVSNRELVMPKLYWPFNKVVIEGENVGSLVKWIGHDASIYPGNSGGALVNMEGRLIGINEISMGISAAIPATQVKRVVAQLIAHGSVRRSWTGLELQPLLHAHEGREGVLISGTVEGSPATEADIQAGDILMAIDGERVSARYPEQMPDVNKRLTACAVDTPVSLALERNGRKKKVSITPVRREKAHHPDHEFVLWGITASNVSFLQALENKRESDDGVLVTSVNQSGAAADARPEIRQGDIIRQVDERTIHTVDDITAYTREKVGRKGSDSTVLVALERNAERIFTVVSLRRQMHIDQGATVQKAWVPVEVQALTRELAGAWQVKAQQGVVVTRVYDTPAAEARALQVGDVITHINDELVPCSHVRQAEVFHSMIRRFSPGDTVSLTRIRNRESAAVQVTLSTYPDMPEAREHYVNTHFGFAARDLVLLDRLKMRLAPGREGVLITEVKEGGWAALANCAVDDIVTGIDGRAVREVDDMKAHIARARKKRASHIVFKTVRGIHTLFIELKTNWDTNE
jgi:serine protease Do